MLPNYLPYFRGRSYSANVFCYMLALLAAITFGTTPLRAQTLTQANAKIDPALQRVMRNPALASSKGVYRSFVPVVSEGVTRYPVIIHADNPLALLKEGIPLNSIYGKMATAQLTAEEMQRLASRVDVASIKLPRSGHTHNDVANALDGVTALQDSLLSNLGYTGKGIVICIFDSGIDWQHLDFRDPVDTTKTRIKYIWDQTLTAQAGEHAPGGTLTTGVEYSASDINAALALSGAARLQKVRTTDIFGHGTHVAGIAAGNGAAYMGNYTGYPGRRYGKYCGVAPEADIIVVRGGQQGSLSFSRAIDAITYADAKAKAMGEPLVINFSFGGLISDHDGTDDVEVAIDTFSSKPGHMIAVSAGNDNGGLVHTSGAIAAGATKSLTYTVSSYTPVSGAGNNFLQVWAVLNSPTLVNVALTTPGGKTYTCTSAQGTIDSLSSEGEIYIGSGPNTANNKREVIFSVDNQTGTSANPAVGTYTLKITNTSSASATFDAWLEPSGLGAFGTGIADNRLSVGTPGNSKQAITVGAYVSRTSWVSLKYGSGTAYNSGFPGTRDSLAVFSSLGPTQDGRIKPDICAPGAEVVSTLTSALQKTGEITFDSALVVPGSRHIILQGTSMSAPHTAGVLALMLQAKPTLTASQAKTNLANSVSTNRFVGTAPNNTWGSGQLNAINAVVQTLGKTNIKLSRYTNYKGGYTRSDDSLASSLGVGAGVLIGQRFTLSDSGLVIGAYVRTVGSAAPYTITGHMLLSIYSNGANNLPGTLLSRTGFSTSQSTLVKALSPGTLNYINLLHLGLRLKAGEYHLVISVPDISGSLGFSRDVSTTSNRATVNTGGGWASAGTYNWAQQLIVASTGGGVITGIDQTNTTSAASGITLGQNYPSPAPANSTTTIPFSLPTAGHATLKLYDFLGREVATLADGTYPAHEVQTVTFKVSGLAAGDYVYRLETTNGNKGRRMVIVQ